MPVIFPYLPYVKRYEFSSDGENWQTLNSLLGDLLVATSNMLPETPEYRRPVNDFNPEKVQVYGYTFSKEYFIKYLMGITVAKDSAQEVIKKIRRDRDKIFLRIFEEVRE